MTLVIILIAYIECRCQQYSKRLNERQVTILLQSLLSGSTW